MRTGTLSAAKRAERANKLKYRDLEDSYIFEPVACETLGSWGKLSFLFLKELDRRLAEHTDEPRAGYFFCQRLSIAIAHGNSGSLMESVPSTPNLELPFYL